MSLFLHFTAFNIFHSGLSIDSRLWSICPDHVLRQNCTTRTELRQGLCETKYIVWKATVQTGCSSVRFRCKASIFIRKTLRVRPRNRIGGLSPTQVHRVGPAFSMKMMFVPDSGRALQPVRTVAGLLSHHRHRIGLQLLQRSDAVRSMRV